MFLLVAVGDGIADDMRRRTANPEMASTCPIASSRRGERQLEMRRAEVSLGGDACFVMLRNRKNGEH
jgi:hypothetical protein